MRKMIFAFALIFFPSLASAEDHDYHVTPITTVVAGGSEALIVDSKTGDIWQFSDQTGGAQDPGGTWIRYLGKLHSGQKIGEYTTELNYVPPIPATKR